MVIKRRKLDRGERTAFARGGGRYGNGNSNLKTEAHWDVSSSSSESDDSGSGSWDEFERQLDNEAEGMLRGGAELSAQEMAELFVGPKRGGFSPRWVIKYLFIILVGALLAILSHTLLGEYGTWVRCPGHKDCPRCYGPFWGKSWCSNPYYESGY